MLLPEILPNQRVDSLRPPQEDKLSFQFPERIFFETHASQNVPFLVTTIIHHIFTGCSLSVTDECFSGNVTQRFFPKKGSASRCPRVKLLQLCRQKMQSNTHDIATP